MKFSDKLRTYFHTSSIKKSHFAVIIGITPPMVSAYLYQGYMPGYKIAKKIVEATAGYITMADMGYD